MEEWEDKRAPAVDSQSASAVCRARRVTLVIDQLEAGGAQRQLCLLAEGLKQRGCEVAVLVFRPDGFFADVLAQAGIPCLYVPSRNLLDLAHRLRRAVRRSAPDAVIAYLPAACALAELAGLPRRRFVLVVSERLLNPRSGRLARYGLHRLADAVVSNSHAQQQHLSTVAPYLATRTDVIVNGVDAQSFTPRQGEDANVRGDSLSLQLLTLGRLKPQKNPFGLLEALAIVREEQPMLDVAVDWYGDHPDATSARGWRRRRATLSNRAFRSALAQAIADRTLTQRFRLHAARHDVLDLYHAAEALCLPSHWEGTSNVVCEAMACGLPVLASRAGDNARLIQDGDNGLLFDASSPRSIADAILRFAALPEVARRRMGTQGRASVIAMSTDVMVDSYVGLLNRLLEKRKGM